MKEPPEMITLESGRTIPVLQFPKSLGGSNTSRKISNRLKRIDAWLVQIAREDAAAMKSDWHITLWKALNPKALSPADRDCLSLYLFGSERGIWIPSGERIND